MMAILPANLGARPAGSPHIVDVLIEERAPRLAAGPWWPLLRPWLYAALHYAEARRLADDLARVSGQEGLDHLARLLALRVEATGLDRIPISGRCIVVCNHPTGIADGVAVYEAVRRVRSDLAFYANADALRISPRLAEVLIPVEWVEAKRTREKTRATVEATRRALEAERALVVFPAGRLSRRQPGGRLLDPAWATSPVSLARRHDAPVVPIHVSGPWSTLFHIFHRISSELRDITLFHEMLNKRARRFDLIVGRPVPPAMLAASATEATAALKRYVEDGLPAQPDRAFA